MCNSKTVVNELYQFYSNYNSLGVIGPSCRDNMESIVGKLESPITIIIFCI